ncbi:hypothetical protein ACTA71_008932 [Dictyostelium dimigraforme]
MTLTKKEFLDELTVATNEVIKYADDNNDKQLSKDEVFEAYRSSGFPNPTLATNSLFELFDEDKDGKLSSDEIKVMVLVDYIIEAETAIKKIVDEIFKADVNQDDEISFDEAKEMFIKNGSSENTSIVYTISMFKDVDINKDNSISRGEFRKYVIDYYDIYPNE